MDDLRRDREHGFDGFEPQSEPSSQAADPYLPDSEPAPVPPALPPLDDALPEPVHRPLLQISLPAGTAA